MNVEDRVKRGGYIPDLDYLHKQDIHWEKDQKIPGFVSRQVQAGTEASSVSKGTS